VASWHRLSFACTDKNISLYYTTVATGPDSIFFEHREIQYLSNFHCLASLQEQTSVFRRLKQFLSKTEQQVAQSHTLCFHLSYSFLFHFHLKSATFPNIIPLQQTGLPAESFILEILHCQHTFIKTEPMNPTWLNNERKLTSTYLKTMLTV